MATEEQFDFRDMRDGDFSWFQNELHITFRPLIGTDAAWLYTTLVWLVPQVEYLREKGIVVEMSITKLQESSGLSRGTTYRSLATLLKIGMVQKGLSQGKGVFELVNLRKLAELGVGELQRRIGVPPGNDAQEPTGGDGTADPAAEDAQSPMNAADTGEAPSPMPKTPQASPAASTADSVPGGNDEREPPKTPENEADSQASFQKPGGSVPETGGPRSKSGGSSFQHGTQIRPFNAFKELSQSQENNTPLPPSRGSADDGPILPFTDCRHGEAGFAVSVGLAARWVAREGGISGSRILPVIAKALTLRCEQAGESLQATAKLATTNYALYLEHADLLRIRWNPNSFFELGHWLRPKSWPYDQAKLDRAQASVGRYDPIEQAQALWVKVQEELVLCLKRLDSKSSEQALEWYDVGLSLTKVHSVVEGSIPVWVLSSNNPPRTRRVLELLTQHVNVTVRQVVGDLVQIRVVAH